jgi:protocatechuate 3,4-dioxygenase beta subunit
VAVKRFVFALLALVGIYAWAQQPAPEPEVRAASISGVITSPGGDVVAGAQILLLQVLETTSSGGMDIRPRRMESDGEGRFAFDDLEPGQYMLQARHPEHVTFAYGAVAYMARPTPFALREGQKMDLSFQMSRAGSVSGRVVDGNDEPVAGYRARVESVNYHDGIRRLGPVAAAITNDNGEYLVENVPPGRFYIRVSFLPNWGQGKREPVRALKPGEVDVRWNETMYPSSRDTSGAAMFNVVAGQETTGIDIEMLELPYYHATGKVIGLNREIGEARVLRLPREPGSGFTWTFGVDIAADGSFDIPTLWPGPFTLALYSREKGIYGWTPVEVIDEPLENIVINAAVTDISGMVRFEGERQLSGKEEDRMRALDVALYANEGPSVVDKRDQPSGEGAFLIQDVPPGKYRTQVDGLPEGCYLKEVRLAGVPVLDLGIDASGGFPDGPLEIVIGTDAGSVTGVVSDSEHQPVGESIVTLVPAVRKFQQKRLYPTAKADANGAFRIDGITPGRYEVFAWEAIEPTAHWDDNYVRPFTARGVNIEIEQSRSENLNLEVIPAAYMNDMLMRNGL